MTQERRHNLPAIRELLLAAFTVEELRSLFVFAMSRGLRPVAGEFEPEDGKPDMVHKAVAYCRSHFLLDELLAEIKEADPRAYARFEDRLYDAVLARGAPALVLPLPADLPGFCGRDAQIGQLCARLDPQGTFAIATIDGPGGSGKTALAVQVAHRLVAQGRFHDIRLLIDLKGSDPAPVNPAEALEALLNAVLGPEPGRPRDLDSLTARWGQAIHGKDALLILDNAADAAQVRPLLPGSASCAVLVTSRRRVVLPGATHLDLEAMHPAEARCLLQVLASRLDVGAADLVAESCGRLPLALRVAGSYLSLHDDVSPDLYARTLAGERARPAQLHAPADLDPGLAAALSLSVSRLDPALRRAWTLLALFPAPFDLVAATALWGEVRDGGRSSPLASAHELWEELQQEEGFDPAEWDEARLGALKKLLAALAGPSDSRCSIDALGEDQTSRRLQALCEHGLLSYDHGLGRYWQHDLVRLAAASDLEMWGGQAVETARLRLACHYEQAARAAKERYEQRNAGLMQGMALLALEWPHICAGQAWAASHAAGGGEAAWLCSEYPAAAGALLSLRLHPHDWIAWLEAATRAARRVGDRNAEASHLGRLGKAYQDLDQTEDAIDYYQQALAVARQIRDRRNEGIWLVDLGRIYHQQDETVAARDAWTRALTIFEVIEDPGAGNVRLLLSGMED